MSSIGMFWGVVASIMLLTAGLGLALFWQGMRCREAQARVYACNAQLELVQAISQARELGRCELAAAVRAEKAHAEELQRQLMHAHEELAGLRDEQQLLLGKLTQAQGQASAARARHGQLLQRHAELKQAHARLQSRR